jgi:hypothetical protein
MFAYSRPKRGAGVHPSKPIAPRSIVSYACPYLLAHPPLSSPQTAVVMDKSNSSSPVPPNDVEDAKLDGEEIVSLPQPPIREA